MRVSVRAGVFVVLLVAPLTGAAACSGAGSAASPGSGPPLEVPATCAQIPQPDGGPMRVTGMVIEVGLDGSTKPVPNAMVAVEYGGLYVPWCDLSHASPYYVFGAFTDATGAFAVDVRAGSLGFHAFATGFFYSRAPLDTSTANSVNIFVERLPATQAKPTVASAGFAKTTVHPGDAVTYAAQLATWAATDPLSDENIIILPGSSWGVELNPPSVGKKDDFPDGLWQRTFTAPTTPGTYTYWFSATTSGCVTSDLVSATLTVQ